MAREIGKRGGKRMKEGDLASGGKIEVIRVGESKSVVEKQGKERSVVVVSDGVVEK